MPFEIKLFLTLIAIALSYLLVTLNPNIRNNPNYSSSTQEDNAFKQLMMKEDGTIKGSAKAIIIGYLALLMGFLWVFF